MNLSTDLLFYMQVLVFFRTQEYDQTGKFRMNLPVVREFGEDQRETFPYPTHNTTLFFSYPEDRPSRLLVEERRCAWTGVSV